MCSLQSSKLYAIIVLAKANKPSNKGDIAMYNSKFGIEIEMTGITRNEAARIAAEHLGGTITNGGDYYDTQKVTAADGRVWKFMFDASIVKQHRVRGRRTSASDRAYSVELVSPILTYNEDINTLQELVRKLRKAGAFANTSCGIHYQKLEIIQS